MTPQAIGAVMRRPWLWAPALVALFRLAPSGWWRRRPFLPIPDRRYWRFRMETAYGGDGAADPAGEDVVAYLTWCRRLHFARSSDSTSSDG